MPDNKGKRRETIVIKLTNSDGFEYKEAREALRKANINYSSLKERLTNKVQSEIQDKYPTIEWSEVTEITSDGYVIVNIRYGDTSV